MTPTVSLDRRFPGRRVVLVSVCLIVAGIGTSVGASPAGPAGRAVRDPQAQASPPRPTLPASSSAEIVSLQGNGQFRPDAAQAWRAAQVRQPLFAGQFVRTGELSRMGLIFVDETQIRLNQNSLLQIKQVAAPGKGDTTVLDLMSGRGWSQSKVAPNRLIVQTPSATAAIRGTDWELSVDEQGASTLTVLSGEIEFFNDLGTVLVAASQQARAEIGRAPVRLLISNPQDRVQWVTAYSVDPLHSIYLYDSRPGVLQQRLPGVPPDSPAHAIERAEILADLGRWDEAKALFTATLGSDPASGPALLGLGFVGIHEGNTAQATSLFTRAEGALARDQQGLLALGRVAAAIQAETFPPAVAALDRMLGEPGLSQAAPFLLLADIMVYSGDVTRALDYARQGLERFPDDDRLHAMLARIYLRADQVAESRHEVTAALAKNPQSLEARLALGDLARTQGDAAQARAAYAAALALNASDARAWYGLGVVNNERENVRRGRRDLRRAVSLNPSGPGYVGELGTLETFANNFAAASAHYTQALVTSPNDYVALTGEALLELKRGHAQRALELLLRAGLLEPRYARAHVYLAVAYYRLGRIARALEELQRASALDPKDPLPHMLASMIDSDIFQPGKAVDAGRTALRLMPYLRSLNQLANNQKGTANLGNAFAFFGMEEWAQTLAQESYYPYWAGSHLFLGDRYPGLFNKNSEYFQGVLADPTVFGASTRYQSLLPKPGNYVTAGSRAGVGGDLAVVQPYVTANGYACAARPTAYFLSVENSELIPRTAPLDGRVNSITGAFGTSVTPELGVFGWGSYEDIDATFSTGGTGVQPSRIASITRKTDVGANYRLSPTSMMWAKWGWERVGQGTTLRTADETGTANIDFFERAASHDLQFRHTVTAGRQEVSWGVETGDRERAQILTVSGAFPGEPTEAAGIRQPITDTSRLAYGADRVSVGTRLVLDGGLFVQRFSKHVTTAYDEAFGLARSDFPEAAIATRAAPRAGLVYRLGDQQLVRVAYQRWVRSASESTLGPVATAGLPLDDQIVALGGMVERVRAQLEWAWSPHTFTVVFADRKAITNLSLSDGIQQAPSLENLQRIRNAVFINLASEDLLEGTPTFGRGKVKAGGVSLNQLLIDRVSVYTRYVFTGSENTSVAARGNLIPYLPRHVAVLGSTWVAPRRFYVGAQAVYRSRRFEDEENEQLLVAGWSGTIRGYWELPSKHVSVEAGVEDLASKVSTASYTIDFKLRY
jgi:tetratricopeptide (TPR) repeat protein